VLREEFTPAKAPPCIICNRIGHWPQFCPGELPLENESVATSEPVSTTKFIFIKLDVLREYLEHELYMVTIIYFIIIFINIVTFISLFSYI
jgi:5'-3' exoribonuclease 2